MRCNHKRQEMTKLLRTKKNKIPEIWYFRVFPVVFGTPRTTPGCITESAEEHQMLTKWRDQPESSNTCQQGKTTTSTRNPLPRKGSTSYGMPYFPGQGPCQPLLSITPQTTFHLWNLPNTQLEILSERKMHGDSPNCSTRPINQWTEPTENDGWRRFCLDTGPIWYLLKLWIFAHLVHACLLRDIGKN